MKYRKPTKKTSKEDKAPFQSQAYETQTKTYV